MHIPLRKTAVAHCNCCGVKWTIWTKTLGEAGAGEKCGDFPGALNDDDNFVNEAANEAKQKATGYRSSTCTRFFLLSTREAVGENTLRNRSSSRERAASKMRCNRVQKQEVHGRSLRTNLCYNEEPRFDRFVIWRGQVPRWTRRCE